MPEPTKSFVMNKAKEYKTKTFDKRNKMFDMDSMYYDLEFAAKMNLPEKVSQYGFVLPTARELVDGGANYLSTSYCRFHRPLRGTSQEAHEQAEMLRQFDMAMFYRTKMESTISPWRVANGHAFLHGMWVFETFYDAYAIPDRPVQEEGESDYSYAKKVMIWDGERNDRLPIAIQCHHPRKVFPEPFTDRPRHVILSEERTLAEIKADFPEWSPPAGVEDEAKLEQIQYCDDRYRGIFVREESVYQRDFIEHGYGFLPFIVGYSGLGNNDVNSSPEKRAVGLIRYLFSALAAESFAFSVYYIIMRSHAWPIKFASGPGAKQVTTMNFDYGTIHELPLGTKVEDMISAPPPETLMDALSYLNGVMASSAAPRSIRGLPETGVRSSVDRSMIMQQASLKYEGVREQMQISTAKVMSNCTKIAERVVPNDMQIWAHTPDADIDLDMKRDKIKHHYTTYAEFSPTNPEEERSRHADMMNLMKTGAISGDTGRRRYLTHIDPDQEAIKIEAERLRANPDVQKILGMAVTSELQMELQRLMKIRQLQQGVLPGQMGLPGMEQQGLSGEGLSQDMATQMRQMQGVANPALPPEQQVSQGVNQRGFLTQKQGGLPGI